MSSSAAVGPFRRGISVSAYSGLLPPRRRPGCSGVSADFDRELAK